MVGVRKGRRERIIEDGRRFSEIDAVRREILFRLRRIPSELHGISVRRVRLLSPGCLTLPHQPRRS